GVPEALRADRLRFRRADLRHRLRQFGDVGWPHSAAPADDARPGGYPLTGKLPGRSGKTRWAGPGAALTVPTLTAVRVHDDRLADIGDRDSGEHVVGGTAIYADRDDLVDPGGPPQSVREWLSGAGPRSVDGVAEPGRHADRAHQVDQSFGLVDIGHRFQSEHVRAGVGQDLQPRTVPARQGRDGQAVAAAIFRPIGQRRAVRSDR